MLVQFRTDVKCPRIPYLQAHCLTTWYPQGEGVNPWDEGWGGLMVCLPNLHICWIDVIIHGQK